jgi:hypothetical protein
VLRVSQEQYAALENTAPLDRQISVMVHPVNPFHALQRPLLTLDTSLEPVSQLKLHVSQELMQLALQLKHAQHATSEATAQLRR